MCKPTRFSGNIYIFHELKFNQWVFVTSERERLTIICDSETYDEPIKGTGLLTMNNGCIGYSRLNKLSPSNQITGEYINIIATIPMMTKDNCCEEYENSSEPVLQLNEIHLANIRLDELHHTSHQLNKFEKDIHRLRNQHKQYSKHTNYFYLGFQITFAIIDLVILYRLLQCLGCFALFKCFDCGKKRTNCSGCCVSIYNQCQTSMPETRQSSLEPMRLSQLQRAEENIYSEPIQYPVTRQPKRTTDN